MTYSVKPEEHELRTARDAVERAVEACQYVVEKEEELEVSLGHIGREDVGEFGAFGEAVTSENARIYFNAEVDGWQENLEDLAADVYGQTWFYENSEVNFVWQQVLASITGLIVIEEISEEKEFEVEGFREEWAEKKTDLSEEISKGHENLSWQLKVGIGRKLLEDNDLRDLPDLNRTDVLEAGDALFE